MGHKHSAHNGDDDGDHDNDDVTEMGTEYTSQGGFNDLFHKNV